MANELSLGRYLPLNSENPADRSAADGVAYYSRTGVLSLSVITW